MMVRLLETIKLYNRRLHALDLHSARMNRTRAELFGCTDYIDLTQKITIPPDIDSGLYRCRLLYSKTIEEIQFIPYNKREIKSIRLVTSEDIDYHNKYEDRAPLESLFALRGECDDVLIVKGGFLTDCSYSNIAFWDGTEWVTPDTPLLAGTKRQALLAAGLIRSAPLTPASLAGFERGSLLNAMLDLDEVVIPIDKIV